MKIEDIDFSLEKATVITSAPQTNPGWSVTSLVKRYNGKLVESGVTKPQFGAYNDELSFITHAESPISAGQCKADELFANLKKSAASNRIVVCLTLSEALVDKYYETGKELARFAVRLSYDASLIVQLQPLKTGRARDTTGRFIVACGPKRETELEERDSFFHVGIKGQVESRTRV